MCVCVCVCVCMRERERERERVLIFVGMIVGGGIMFEAYNKSVPLSSVCVCMCVYVCVCMCACVFVYSRDSACQKARVRELKVILMLVLVRHECV